jgi:hypothetical protein
MVRMKTLPWILALLVVAVTLGDRAPAAQAASSPDLCASGSSSCLVTTIAEMQAQFETQASSCDHDAVFSLAYLRTTQTYAWARDQRGYFADTAWVNHEDSLFAGYFFTAFDAYSAGSPEVPPAWQIAFDAAKYHQVTALGDALLGMNAHINRDLPFVLASVGLTSSDGTSHKPDHDKVNLFLSATIGPLLNEIAARFDPTVTEYGSLGTAGVLLLIEGWRELAWDNAELLVDAPSPAVRAVFSQQIETAAAIEAEAIVATNSYLPVIQSPAIRDAYCAAHYGDSPPTPYAFGPATA